MVGECTWARFIYMEPEEVIEINSCCRHVAEQLYNHNKFYEEYCE